MASDRVNILWFFFFFNKQENNIITKEEDNNYYLYTKKKYVFEIMYFHIEILCIIYKRLKSSSFLLC